MGFAPDDRLCRALLAYIELLAKWNKTYSLTAVRDPTRMVTHHVLDSMAILPYLNGSQLLDVGTGAGLPGVVLALVRRNSHWVLLDSNAKKIRFVTQAVMELKLGNVEVVRARVEDYRPRQRFSSVIARAFGPVSELYERTRHLYALGGCLLAMKGGALADELAELRRSGVACEVYRLQVPGLSAQRNLVIVRSD
ncbi:MAG: 16S rRNA (guanine(527)-N(7))-methyltransferase RsmG [Gammaproteobacteria bacterium]|nr:16S rRNA (guanine(527)-N(7))-methyltransferase RsmG [Gammaproteobacteria bacterium]